MKQSRRTRSIFFAAALLALCSGPLPRAVFGQNAVSKGNHAGFRMYYPSSNDWWLDPSRGNFDIRVNGGLPLATMDGLGHLGIGTTSPSYTLDVNGVARVVSNLLINTAGSAGSPIVDLQAQNGGPWALRFYRQDLGGGPQLYASDIATIYESGNFQVTGNITAGGDVYAAGNLHEAGALLSSKYASTGGSNASGTWPISVTGNAATATTANNLSLSASTNGTSKMVLGLTGKNVYKRSDSTGDTNYWTGSMGWGATYDFNTVFMQGDGFTDTWGTSLAGAPEAGYVHSQGIQVEHYNNGSTGYGWQMNSGNAVGGNWYLRYIWGGGFSSWYKIIHDQNINSYAPTLTGAGASGTWNITASANVLKTGDTMSGPLILSGNPTSNLGAATKQYVDAAGGGGLPGSWTCTLRSNSVGQIPTVTVSCVGNEKVVSGGCYGTGNCAFGSTQGYPAGQGWTCQCASTPNSMTAYANCCQ